MAVELLAPAGNEEALIGALNAGADAVYLGGPKFGARAYADNFTEESLLRGIRTAHILGKRIYLTVNILTRQEELPELVAMVRRFYEGGLDGVIVQDLGVLQALREACPGLELHASTQMSVSSSEAVRLLKTLGVCRVVPARELSLREIRAIKDETGIEIESFIHGAMCYSYSGRCLMSSFLGGRSGNRGRCAGTCRLPYAVLDENHEEIPLIKGANSKNKSAQLPRRDRTGFTPEVYPISMRDMCVLDILPDLIDAGIDSFKIEGRMKKPEYAAGTTAIYRKYIDRFYAWDQNGRPGAWKIDPADRRELLSLYIRTDLSTGYYNERNGRDLVTIHEPGYAGADDALLARIRQQYLQDRPRRFIEGYAYVYADQEMIFDVWTKDHAFTAHAQGGVAESAKKKALSMEDIAKRLSKTGETDFIFADSGDLTVETDGASFIPVSTLNELRRSALEELSKAIAGSEQNTDAAAKAPGNIGEQDAGRAPFAGTLYAMVQTKEQLLAALPEADLVIADAGLVDELANLIEEQTLSEADRDGNLAALLIKNFGSGRKRDAGDVVPLIFAALPAVFRASDRAWMNHIWDALHEKVDGFYVRTLEEIEFLREKGYDGKVAAGPTLYHWNDLSKKFLQQHCDMLVLPLELSGHEMQETFASDLSDEVLTVYGYLPLMVTANCVRKTTGRCEHTEGGFYYLKDRKGISFPVRTDCRHCTNIIYNSVPLSLHAAHRDRLFQNAGGILCSFTRENGAETAAVLHAYRTMRFGTSKEADAAAQSLIKTMEPVGFTGGHYRKGAI